MKRIDAFSHKRPLLFVLLLIIAWLGVFIVSMALAAQVLGKPYGDPSLILWGDLATAACLLLLAWRLGWLKACGIARLGRWQIWLLALASLVYLAWANLYALYGKATFDFWALLRLPDARSILLTQLAVGASEEFLFRGLVLYTLLRAWGHTRRGSLGALLVASLLFALLHLSDVLTFQLSAPAALLLSLQTFLVALWWGVLVMLSGSLWPAVLQHWLVNALAGIQGLSMSLVEPDTLAYARNLYFSIPLALIGLWLAARFFKPGSLSASPSQSRRSAP